MRHAVACIVCTIVITRALDVTANPSFEGLYGASPIREGDFLPYPTSPTINYLGVRVGGGGELAVVCGQVGCHVWSPVLAGQLDGAWTHRTVLTIDNTADLFGQAIVVHDTEPVVVVSAKRYPERTLLGRQPVPLRA